MEGQQLCTPEVWEKLAEISLRHWVAFSLDGSQIIASGPSYKEVCDEARKIYGDEFMIMVNPRVLLTPQCFVANPSFAQ